MKRKAPVHSLLVDSTDRDMAKVLRTVSSKVQRSLAKADEIHHQRLKMIRSSKVEEQAHHHA
ncbi:hypothetical protein ACM26W_11975 [Halomonas sp. HK25]|uniref:hypothetical protein n=1 Tax=Halomonas sp. HK25 TaxID=3394321 RepID=UPI0039FC26B3